MRLRVFTACLAFLAVALVPGVVGALTISASFTASGFGGGAPTDPVTGSYTVTFPEPTTGIEFVSGTVDAIALTIAGKTYTTAEVSASAGYTDAALDWYLLGTQVDPAACIISQFTDDFCLNVQFSNPPSFFQYTVEADPQFYFAGAVAINVIPEPSTALLTGIALLAARAGTRRRTTRH